MKLNKDTLFLAITSGFGLGLIPGASGTYGALVGLAWHLVAFYAGWSANATRIWCLAGIALFLALHYLLTPWAQRYWNDSDPHHYILDEIPGYLVVPVLSIQATSLQIILLGFVLERICDIIKLPVARYFDRKVHTPTGVVMDDIIAGVYAAAMLSAVILYLRAH